MSQNLPQHHWQICQYVDGDDRKERHRELVTRSEKPGKKKLSLVLEDERFKDVDKDNKEYIVIPLGHGLPTVSNDSSRPENPEEFDHFFIPIIPKRYTTAQPDKQRTADLRDGWLYVFRNGYLWRELQVLKQGMMKDVNLQAFQGKDLRPASGQVDSRVIVPYKVNGELQTIQVAYSEVQWSWARINAMGGMNPDEKEDPRLKPDTLMPQVTQSEAEKNRNERMQRICASLTQWLQKGDGEHIQSVSNLSAGIYSLKLHEKSELPVVALFDPLGVARELAGKYQAAWGEMDELIGNLRNPDHEEGKTKEYPFAPWFDSAVLANRYFFGKLPDIEPEGQRPPSGKDKDQWVRARGKREKWKKQLSKADIDQALGVARRAEIREKILATKQALVAYLDSPDFEVMLPLRQALDDYFTLPAPEDRARFASAAAHYGSAWRIVEGLIAKLGDHQYALDAGLEADPPNLHQLSQTDPGAQFLLKMADPQQGYFLQSRLFPRPAGGNNPLAPELAPSSENGPEFRPQHIQDAFKRDPEGYADFFSHFIRVAGLADTDHARNNLLRLINATLGLDLYEREITPAEYQSGELQGDDVLLRMFALHEQFEGKVPGRESDPDFENQPAQGKEEDPDRFQVDRRAAEAGAGGADYLNKVAETIEKETVTTDHAVISRKGTALNGVEPVLEGASDNYRAQSSVHGRSPVNRMDAGSYNGGQVHLPGGGKGTVQIYGHDGKLLGGATVNAFKQGKAYTRRQWRTKVHNTQWEKVTVRTVVSRQAKGLPALAKKLYDKGVWTRGILPILVGVEVWNAKEAYKTLQEKKGTELAARAWVDFIGSLADIAAISGVVTQARIEYVAKRETGLSVNKILKNGGPLADKIRLSRLAARGLGAAAGLYSMGLSLHDMIENLRQGDDAAVAHGLMAGGFAMATVAEAAGFIALVETLEGTAIATTAGTIAGGPWLWVGLGTVFAGAALLTWVFTEDTPLEEWLANGPFSVRQPAQLYEQELPVLGRRKYWREANGTQVIFKKDDVLEKILYPAGGRFVEKDNGSVYLEEENGETLIGKIGQPFTAWDKLMDKSGRFAGHEPGNEAEDKFGRWCETPRSASLALADAIYRPRLGLQINQNPNLLRAAEITIQIPNFIEEKSLLYVELWENDTISHQGIESFTSLGSGPRTVRVVWPLTGKGNAQVKAKVRMDLYGNGDVWLPSPENSNNEWIEAEEFVELPQGIDTRRIFHGDR